MQGSAEASSLCGALVIMIPEGLRTQCWRYLVHKTIPPMVWGTKVLKCCVRGPFGEAKRSKYSFSPRVCVLPISVQAQSMPGAVFGLAYRGFFMIGLDS